MNSTKYLMIAMALVSLPALGATRKPQVMDMSKFDSLTNQQMNNQTLYYNDKMLSFSDWTAQFPAEKEALSLFSGYTEPTVTYIKNGIKKQRIEELMVFVGRTKMLLNQASRKINLKGLVDIENVRRFDKEIQHIAIPQAQIMSNVVGKAKVKNFAWCNKDGDYILRPAKEVDVSHIVAKARNWCDSPARTLCVESCYLFDAFWYEGVNVVNLGMEESEKKDYGIAMQSEIRYFTSERELGLPVPLKELTKLDTPVRGGLEQNMFYFNQVMEFGKVITVFQDDPNDATKTVMTTFFAIGVKKRTYNMFGEIKNILMGNSAYFNTGSGITAGLPVFTQNTIMGIADVLEN